MITALSNLLLAKLTSTVITTIIMGGIYFTLTYLFGKYYKNKKQFIRVKARIFYIMLVIYIIIFARLWIEGFGNIFTVLGLVSAALVVTNKETIMNLMAWFFISWRGLFAEGDFIELNKVSGYVHSIGAFYFTLSNKKAKRQQHAQLTKIPNGLVLNNTLINYSQTDALYAKSLRLVFSPHCNYEEGVQAFEAIIKQSLQEEMQRHNEMPSHEKSNNIDSEQLLSSLKFSMKLNLDKPSGVECIWTFDCYFSHHQNVENQIWQRWLAKMPHLNNIEMVFS